MKTWILGGSLLILLWPSAAGAQNLMDLLDKGPVVTVLEKDGRFESALAVIHVKAPIETVWETATDFEHYPQILPKLARTEVTRVTAKVVDVTFEIEVPGMNPVYTMRYRLSKKRWLFGGRWKQGDIKGVYNRWVLIPYHETETLVYFTTSSKNFNRMAQALEDDQQTLTVGLNVTSALANVKSVRRAAEARARKKAAEATAPAPAPPSP